MFLDQLATAGSLPVLGATMRFAAERQKLLSHNIANLETPHFRPVDVEPRAFQRTLQEAIGDRRGRTAGTHGKLRIDETRQIKQGSDGSITLDPRTPTGNILFHDRNNRDLERTMQKMVENAGQFRLAAELMRARGSVLNTAITERVA